MIKEIFELQNPWRFKAGFSFNLKDRDIISHIINNLDNNKIIGLIGSRQVGKSSIIFLMIQHLIRKNIPPQSIFYFNLDDLKLQELFYDIPEFIQFIGKENARKFIFIDEIQRLKNPGLFLKELYDLGLNIKIIYSGSSQLEIKSKLKEHLVGRVRQFEIHRLSFSEYLSFAAPVTKKQALTDMLVFGSYPAVALETQKFEKKMILKDIYQSYIEKDITDFLRVENTQAFNLMAGLLANQSGQLLNIDNLATSLKITRKETEKYISILEQTFIIKRIYPFYRNYKKEITKTPKIYFMDLGLRNYAANNYNDIDHRNDQGNLFENFFLLELLCKDQLSQNKINFWRTTNQTEIDFIVTGENGVEAIEVKWEKETIPKSFQTIVKYYPEISTKIVTKKYFL
jgi:predicted AAA+ superfamily ATPase